MSSRTNATDRLTDADINAKWKYSPKKIGAMIRARRMAMGLSQVQMANNLNVARSTLNYWEKGKVPLALVVCFNYLLEDDDTVSNMWQKRAILAEGTLKDITDSVIEYRHAGRRGIKDNLR